MKKLFAFVCFCAYIVGAIGGFAYALMLHKGLIAVCVAALAAMAFPYFKKCWDELNGNTPAPKKK